VESSFKRRFNFNVQGPNAQVACGYGLALAL